MKKAEIGTLMLPIVGAVRAGQILEGDQYAQYHPEFLTEVLPPPVFDPPPAPLPVPSPPAPLPVPSPPAPLPVLQEPAPFELVPPPKDEHQNTVVEPAPIPTYPLVEEGKVTPVSPSKRPRK